LEKHELEVCLIDFAFRIIHIKESLPKQELDICSFLRGFPKKSTPQTLSAAILQLRNALLHHSKFLVRYSIFIRRYFGGFVFKFTRTLEFYPPFLWRALNPFIIKIQAGHRAIFIWHL
jgi:hypothetical protein